MRVQQYLAFNLWAASQFCAADSSCTLKSPLPLQPQGMLTSGHLSVRKARHKPHTLGNSGAGCQDGSKHSARGHWQRKIFCKQQNYFCCLWIVSSNLSVPVSSVRSAMGDSSDISPVQSLTCSPALPSKFLSRTTQSYERIPQPTPLSCLSCSRGTWLLVSP